MLFPTSFPDISCVSSKIKFIEGLDILAVSSFSPVFPWLSILHSSSSAFKSTSVPFQEKLWCFQSIYGEFYQSALAVFLKKAASCICSSLPELLWVNLRWQFVSRKFSKSLIYTHLFCLRSRALKKYLSNGDGMHNLLLFHIFILLRISDTSCNKTVPVSAALSAWGQGVQGTRNEN